MSGSPRDGKRNTPANEAGRVIAIGDVHGYAAALEALLAAVRPQREDVLVLLGDYIDRGPDSRGTLEVLLELQQRCRLIPILGNHDEMLLDVLANRSEGRFADWLSFGGSATLASYGCATPDGIPHHHISFLRRCLDYYETEQHFFLHANYVHDASLDRLSPWILRWESLRQRVPGPHMSGKTAILGHTSQKTGEVLDHGYLKCIDTYCYGGGWLTALDVGTGRVWQVSPDGRPRQPQPQE